MRSYISSIVLATICFLATTASAQKQPPIVWQRSLGGTGNDRGVSVAALSPFAFVVCGTTNSANGDVTVNHGDDDIWVVKLNGTGNVLWEKTYGDGRADIAAHIVPAGDGGFIVGGTTWPIFVPPTDTNFLQWWIFKIDSVGTMQWEKKYGGSAPDNLTSIDLAADGSIYCVGHSASSDRDFPVNKGNFDIWVMKLTATGELIWKRSFAGSSEDRAYQIRATADGGCVLAGKTASTDGDMTDNKTGSADGFIAKLAANGDVEWKKVYGTAAAESFNALTPLRKGGYVVVGITQGTGEPNGDYDILRLDPSGDIIWEKFYGGSGRDEATAVLEVGSGYQVLGTSTSVIDSIPTHRGLSDWLLYRLDTNGNNGIGLFSRWFGGTGEDRSGNNLAFAFPGYISVGTTNSQDSDVTANHGNSDIWVVKYGGGSADVDEVEMQQFFIYPNPAHDKIAISVPEATGSYRFTIANTAGEEVKAFAIEDTSKQYNIRDLPSGMYVITLYQNDVIAARTKLIKE